MVYSKLRRHKVMEKVIKKLMANNLPPRFKFKDTYDSIEVPSGYTLPTQQEIEDEFDSMIAEEETMPTVALATDDLKIISSNVYSNVSSGKFGIGTSNPAYELDVLGDINFSGNLYQDGSIFVSGGGDVSTLWNESNVQLSSNGTLILAFDDQSPSTPFTGTLGGNKSPIAAVRDTTNGYIHLTKNATSEIGTVYWQVTLTSSWEAEFEIKAISRTYGGADDMRFIFFSQNPMTSVDYGLGAPFIRYEYYGSDFIEIWEPSSSTTDSMVQSASWSMPMSQWLPVKITYNNGVFTSVIKNSSGTILNTITRNFGTTYSSLHDVPTYVGITGRSGGVVAEDFVRNITIKATNVPTNIYVQKLNTPHNVGIGTTNPSYKLDVLGDINFTGDLYQNGTAFTPQSSGGSSSVGSIVCDMTRGTSSFTTSSGSNYEYVFNTTVINTGSAYNTSNGRFTPTTAGWYLINWSVVFKINSTNSSMECFSSLHKNNSFFIWGNNFHTTTSHYHCSAGSALVYMNGSDSLHVEFFHNTGSNATLNPNGSAFPSRFQAIRLT